MRILKYRAYIKSLKWVVPVLSINFNEEYGWVCVELSPESDAEYDLGDVELMQSTGLKDKVGNEIYEGDILLFNNSINDEKWKCAVVHRHGSFVCEYLKNRTYNHFDCWNVPKVSWEVIGNIYENPELLEVPK